MKLIFNETKSSQPDPFIFEDNGTFYLYVTSNAGVEAYESKTLMGEWIYKGTVTAFADAHDFWAPSVIKLENKYYMYVSCVANNNFQYMHVACADSPLGPFKNEKCLYDQFSIDSHMVKTNAGLFLWYAKNNLEHDLVGTRIYVDRFIELGMKISGVNIDHDLVEIIEYEDYHRHDERYEVLQARRTDPQQRRHSGKAVPGSQRTCLSEDDRQDPHQVLPQHPPQVIQPPIYKRRFLNMKTMITMMNAMKVYKTDELVHDRENTQQKLSADLNARAYEKLVDQVQQKYFLNRA